MMYIAKLEHTSESKRIPICSRMLQDSAVGLNGLDIDDYFEFLYR